MANLKALLLRLVQEDSGQDLIEYALVAALIALGALVGMKTLANDIGNAFNSVGSTLTSAAAYSPPASRTAWPEEIIRLLEAEAK